MNYKFLDKINYPSDLRTLSINDLEKVLKLRKRKNCAPPAPAHGLYLSKIIY